MFTIFRNAASIILSLTCCQVHVQNIFLLGMEVIFSLIFERICIGKVELCVYGCVGADLGHYFDESCFQSLC